MGKMRIYPDMLLAEKVLYAKICRRNNIPCSPYKVTICPTYSCNCRCKLCGIWKLAKKGRELSAEEYSETFKKFGKSLVWLGVSGGEPFLRHDIGAILKAASDNCKNLRLININTNGIQTRKVISVLDKFLGELRDDTRVYLAVSLDGPKNIHNFMRGRKDAYFKTISTLQELRKLMSLHKNFYFETETLICKLNIHSLGAFERQPGRHFTFAQESSHYNNVGTRRLHIRDMSQIKQIMRKMARAMPLVSLFDVPKKVFLVLASRHANMIGRSQILPCYAAWASVLIDPYGSVKPCVTLDTELGSLRESGYDLGYIMWNKQAFAARELIKSRRCANCWTPCEASVSILQSPLMSLLRCFM